MRPLFTVTLLWLTLACGREGDVNGESSPADTMSDHGWLTHPTEEELIRGDAVEGSYLVAFKGVPTGTSSAAINSYGIRKQTMHGLADKALGKSELISIDLLANLNLSDPQFSFKPLLDRLPGPSGLELRFHNPKQDRAAISKVQFSSQEAAHTQLHTWYEQGVIWYAEPNYISKPKGVLEDDIITNFNDPVSFPWLDQIAYISTIQYFNENPAVDSPVIAVLDSGVDVLHPALADNIYLNTDGQNQLCLEDLYGCDTTDTKKDVLGRGTVYPAGTSGFNQSCNNEQSNCAHGTHVTGIIAAQDSSYVGVCPYCRVLVVKVVGIKEENGRESFQIEDSAIIAGLAYVSGFTVGGEPLVRVINASFGKFQKSRSVGLFIESLTKFGRGILTVAAAGNEDTMKPQYPAAFEDVIAVSSVDSSSDTPQKAPSSNFGMWVDISAPGSGSCRITSGILSSIPGGLSYCTEGTSMASPVVAGVAGLVLAAEPTLDYDQLRSRVLNSAVPDNLYRDGVNNAFRPRVSGQELVPLLGGGVVNALAAVDLSVEKSDPIFTEKRDAVRPGCGSIGAQGSSWWSLALLLLPLYLLNRKKCRHRC
ncbi:S8 family peptidase [Pseudobacteriovorax antillogorgiicola]|uniref:Subtilase family protein n=1 Tax=Pseudobacteriovorax antillogorgiicola TaxID=1513793 RepID=A0A1Y6BN13_9BACT|nr:S8 family serine peptidase [Pseudobacteriovorax antillogorgiicola]TCS53911.1 subtilase family protein [Pseudobacteriovorax antillogorgiicola]SMF20651.1 Subtilase family protein [Pseudobacteriovorax antillogorgiicola]